MLQEVAIDYRDHTAQVAVKAGGASVAAFRDQGGQIIEISSADREAWAAAMPNIAKSWADGLEERGLPGHAILKAYMDIMRANDQPILRHWIVSSRADGAILPIADPGTEPRDVGDYS